MWKFVKAERDKERKGPIASWNGMVAKIKETYLPKDYEIQLRKRRHSLRQKDGDVTSYIKNIQKLYLRTKMQEQESVKLARYLNGLKWSIKQELNLVDQKFQWCY